MDPKAKRRAKFERTAKAVEARHFQGHRRDVLEDDLQELLGLLCSRWGFCSGPLADDIVASFPRLTADDFALAVLQAEGFEPRGGLAWQARIAEAFRYRYGDAEVDCLNWSSTV